MMNDQLSDLWDEAQQLASRRYDVEVSEDVLTDGTKVFVVKNPELPGCMAHGKTIEEALKALEAARADLIYYMLVDNLDIPLPGFLRTSTGAHNQKVTFSFKTATAAPSSDQVFTARDFEEEEDTIVEADTEKRPMTFRNRVGNFA